MVLVSNIRDAVSVEAILAAERNINSAISVINVVPNKTTMLPIHSPPPNRHIPQQRSYFSTKRKNKKPSTRIAKPSRQEGEQIKTALLHNVSLYSLTETGRLQKASKCGLTCTHTHTKYTSTCTCILHVKFLIQPAF